MGWSRGSKLMSELIWSMKPTIPDETRLEVYQAIIPVFEAHHCDTLDECFDDDPVFVEAYCLLNPDEAGYHAAGRGEPATSNPYSTRSKKGREWKAGWCGWHDDNRCVQD